MSTTVSPIAALEELCLARGLSQFTDAVERLAAEIAGSRPVRLYRFDASAGVLDRPGMLEAAVLVAGGTPLGRCALEGAVTSGVADDDPLARAAGVQRHHTALPLIRHGSVAGVLDVVHADPTLAAEVVSQLQDLCRVAASIQPFAADREDFQAFSARTQDLLIRAVEQLTPEGEGHVLRVARLAAELAEQLDLSTHARSQLWQACLYHDVGKLALAGSPPADVERLHASAGADFLASSASLRAAAPIVAAHHERYDGSGAPLGLRGADIPLTAAILALAEDFDEFACAHADVSDEDWLHDFYEARAPHHHPDVVEALTELLDRGGPA